MAILQVMSYDSYPFDNNRNFITHPQNGLERHLSGLHKMYWQKSYYLLINDYNQSIVLKSFDQLGQEQESYLFSSPMNSQFEMNDTATLTQIIKLIDETCDLEVIHFHFQKPIVLDLLRIFKESGKMKLIHTMHDLFYACGSYYYDTEYQMEAIVQTTLNLLDVIIYPDESVKQIYAEKFTFRGKSYVIPHGTDILKQDSKICETDFKVLFLGAMNKAKGGEIVSEIVEQQIPHLSWHVLGRLETAALVENKNIQFTYHGEYTSYDLAETLNQIQPNLIVLPSQMIETFSYNLADSLGAGIPVVVPKKGAFLRLTNENVHWFVEEQSSDAYLEQISKIVNNPSEYQQKLQNAKHQATITVEQMNLMYKEHYGGVTAVNSSVKAKLVQATTAFTKQQYHQLVLTHQAFLQEQANAQQHLVAYQQLADEHNRLAEEYHNLIEHYHQQQQRLEQLESLLSKRLVGRMNRYLLDKDSVSKK